MKQVAVVIPIYHEKLEPFEEIAIQQAIKVLSRYDIYILCPQGINLKKYEFLRNFFRQYVSPECLESIATYNRLMLTKSFYEYYSKYEYILIYQTDAFVFTDKLELFCRLGYDYIGAPILNGTQPITESTDITWGSNALLYVGNGGLSLRKISSFLIRFDQLKMIDFWGPEDIFWSQQQDENFIVAPIPIASRFSIESNVEICMAYNDGRLPFGCHQWFTMDFDFWSTYIEDEGYDLTHVPRKRMDTTQYFKNMFCVMCTPTVLKCVLVHIGLKVEVPIFIFGSGYMGRKMAWILLRAGYNVVGFLDNNHNNSKKKLYGVTICHPNDVVYHAENIIIASEFYADDIYMQIIKENYNVRVFWGRDIIQSINKFVDVGNI